VRVHDNVLLRMLDPESSARLTAIGALAAYPTGTVLLEPDDLIDAIHFPLGASLAAQLVTLEGGASAEGAQIGRDGMIGVQAGDGPTPAFAQHIIIQGGTFLRVALPDFLAARQQSPALADVAARYAASLAAQHLQSVACNAVHSLEQRTARWLLAAAERTGDLYISVTQEQLGALLGAGRSYTSRQIQHLKARGLVRTRRGGVAITDYEGIAKQACSCHQRIKDHARILFRDRPEGSTGQTDLHLQSMG